MVCYSTFTEMILCHFAYLLKGLFFGDRKQLINEIKNQIFTSIKQRKYQWKCNNYSFMSYNILLCHQNNISIKKKG